jgi:hypothetical protein
MSEPSAVGPEKTTPPKKPISPARNIIGLILLAAVLVVCWFEYSAVLGFNAAVKALETRTQNEEQGLATVAEAEKLLNREADGPAEEFTDGAWRFNKKTYTWKGLLKQHTLTAYYTREQDARLHHFETEGQKYDLKANREPVQAVEAKGGGGGISVSKGQGGRGGGNRGGGGEGKSKEGADSKGKESEPKDTAAKPKTEAAPADKAGTPKSEPSDKATAPKSEPAADASAKTKPAEPIGKGETPKK